MKTLTFVIPVYNEEKRLTNTLKALQELQLPAGLKLDEIIFVDDGSTDKTLSRLSKWQSAQNKEKVTIITYGENRGKGNAVKQGMLASTADYTLLFDADISTPLSQINKFLPAMEKHLDVIIGTRKNGKSTVVKHQPLYREVLGRVFTKLAHIIIGTNVTDFTCGFKAFSTSAKQTLFTRATINRWGYDAEILFLAAKYHLSLQEVPVRWSDVPGSRVAVLKDSTLTLKELLTIRVRDITGTYTPSPTLRPSLT